MDQSSKGENDRTRQRCPACSGLEIISHGVYPGFPFCLSAQCLYQQSSNPPPTSADRRSVRPASTGPAGTRCTRRGQTLRRGAAFLITLCFLRYAGTTRRTLSPSEAPSRSLRALRPSTDLHRDPWGRRTPADGRLSPQHTQASWPSHTRPSVTAARAWQSFR